MSMLVRDVLVRILRSASVVFTNIEWSSNSLEREYDVRVIVIEIRWHSDYVIGRAIHEPASTETRRIICGWDKSISSQFQDKCKTETGVNDTLSCFDLTTVKCDTSRGRKQRNNADKMNDKSGVMHGEKQERYCVLGAKVSIEDCVQRELEAGPAPQTYEKPQRW